MRRTGFPLIPLALPPARTRAARKGAENTKRGQSMQTVQVQEAVAVSSSARGQARTRPVCCRPTEPSLSLERTFWKWSLDPNPRLPLPKSHDLSVTDPKSLVKPKAPYTAGRNSERTEDQYHHQSPAHATNISKGHNYDVTHRRRAGDLK